MENERYIELVGITNAWSFGLQQDVVTLLRRLKGYSVSFEEFEEYVQERKGKATDIDPEQIIRRKEQRDKFLRLLPDCPKCEHHPYELIAIGGCKGRANIHGYKSMMYCDECGHHEYSAEHYGVRYERILQSEAKG